MAFPKCAFIADQDTDFITPGEGVVHLLLIGGDKSTQKRDIKKAIEMAATLEKDRP